MIIDADGLNPMAITVAILWSTKHIMMSLAIVAITKAWDNRTISVVSRPDGRLRLGQLDILWSVYSW